MSAPPSELPTPPAAADAPETLHGALAIGFSKWLNLTKVAVVGRRWVETRSRTSSAGTPDSDTALSATLVQLRNSPSSVLYLRPHAARGRRGAQGSRGA